MIEDKKVKGNKITPSDGRHQRVDSAMAAGFGSRIFRSTGQVGTSARSLSSESQLPGAYAIPGPQLVRQDRIIGSFPNESNHEVEPNILIEARVVDEEQPPLIFEASLLRTRKNWKWIITVCCLLFLLTVSVAAMFIQESKRRNSSELITRSQTNDQSEKGPTPSPVAAVQTNTPSIDKDMAQSQFPTRLIKQQETPPTLFPKEKPTITPSTAQLYAPSAPPFYIKSKAPEVSEAQDPSAPSVLVGPSSETPYIKSYSPSIISNFSFPPTTDLQVWKEIGESIIGEDEGDNLGRSIALSEDGKILAIGICLYNFDTKQKTGKVRIFRLEKDNSWKQIGQEIIGIAEEDQAGRSVDLSSDGSIVAVGYKGMVQVFIYDRDYNFWYPLGRRIGGSTLDFFFGKSISLSNDGTILMVATDVDDGNGKYSGKVQIFHYSKFFNQWNLLGQTFHGDVPVEAISLNGPGNIAALGVPNATATSATNEGLVRVYKRSDMLTSVWNPLGDAIRKNEKGFGASVDLSEDGKILAVSSQYGVYLYHFDTKIRDWVKSNATIHLEVENMTDTSTEVCVSLSPNGGTLAVSSARSSSSGTVQVYKFNEHSSLWVQVGHATKSPGSNAGPAPSISLSNGTRLAVDFVYYNDKEELIYGKVQVYEL